MYTQPSYQDPSALFHTVQYAEPQAVPHNLQYTAVHPTLSAIDTPYAAQDPFPTPPPLQRHSSHPDSPEAYQSEYAQQDLADLLGSLKVNEAGTGRLTARIIAQDMRLTTNDSALLEQQVANI